jgi:hypothetical protein
LIIPLLCNAVCRYGFCHSWQYESSYR